MEIKITTKKYGTHIVLIDEDDYNKLTNKHIVLKRDSTYKNETYYAYCNNKRLHRLITDCPDGFVVDHINHNTLDNRRSNLRICTNRENSQNKKYKKKHNYKYIYYHSRDKVYEIYYILNNKRFYVGRNKNIEEAIKIRDRFLEDNRYE